MKAPFHEENGRNEFIAVKLETLIGLNEKAIITGVSWFGNLGAVFPQYEAAYKNGLWELKLISMAIS